MTSLPVGLDMSAILQRGSRSEKFESHWSTPSRERCQNLEAFCMHSMCPTALSQYMISDCLELLRRNSTKQRGEAKKEERSCYQQWMAMKDLEEKLDHPKKQGIFASALHTYILQQSNDFPNKAEYCCESKLGMDWSLCLPKVQSKERAGRGVSRHDCLWLFRGLAVSLILIQGEVYGKYLQHANSSVYYPHLAGKLETRLCTNNSLFVSMEMVDYSEHRLKKSIIKLLGQLF